MRKLAHTLGAASFGWALFGAGAAYATTDLPGQYDARAVALGGTGTSYIENGSSVFLNPATLDGVQNFAGTAVISPFEATMTSPVMGPDTTAKSDGSIFPLFLAGAGYRLSDHVVLGFAVYPSSGFGATYANVAGGGDMSLTLAQMEVSPAVSYRVADDLSFGLGYRITYTRETSHLPASPAGPASEATLTGTSFFGLHAGVYYRPTSALHFGFTYRSRTSSSLSGTTESGGLKFDTKQDFSSTDRFKLGASYALLDRKLLVALDLKYLLYSSTNKSIDTTVTTPMGSATNSLPLDWKNVFAVGFGAEFWATSALALRAGSTISQSATPDHTANFFLNPPGLLYSVHAGAGMSFTNLDLDLGGYYAVGSHHVSTDPAAPTVAPGEYGSDTVLVSLSGTYRM